MIIVAATLDFADREARDKAVTITAPIQWATRVEEAGCQASCFAADFPQPRPALWAGVYLQGLLLDGERKSIEPLSRRVTLPDGLAVNHHTCLVMLAFGFLALEREREERDPTRPGKRGLAAPRSRCRRSDGRCSGCWPRSAGAIVRTAKAASSH